MRAATLAAALALVAPAAFADDFGTVDLVTGQASVQLQDGRVVSPSIGMTVPAGAELVTGRDGELHVVTADSGFIALRPNTRLRVAEYRAEGDDLDTQVLSLLRGTFRSVTGWIGRNNASRYRITTPTATIGVRGTDHEPSYLLAEDIAAAGAGEPLAPGTYDKVNEGASYIENAGGRIEIGRDESGFAPRTRAKPVRLRAIPRVFKVTRHEARIQERREHLKKIVDKRRTEKRKAVKERRERQKAMREKHRGPRQRD